MCGISGMIGLEAGDATVEKMLGTMSRRGPDSSGIYRNGQAVLLHARLAVIDLQGGITVALNGKITAEIALPVAGLLSKKSVEETAAEFERVREAFERLDQFIFNA